MSFTYGHFRLEMTCQEFDNHVGKIIAQLAEQNSGNLTGTPTYNFDQYRENLPPDLSLLSIDVPNYGTKVCGVAFTNPMEFQRMYMVADSEGFVMFLDADPEYITGLGLKYDRKAKTIIDPATGKIILKDFM